MSMDVIELEIFHRNGTNKETKQVGTIIHQNRSFNIPTYLFLYAYCIYSPRSTTLGSVPKEQYISSQFHTQKHTHANTYTLTMVLRGEGLWLNNHWIRIIKKYRPRINLDDLMVKDIKKNTYFTWIFSDTHWILKRKHTFVLFLTFATFSGLLEREGGGKMHRWKSPMRTFNNDNGFRGLGGVGGCKW